MTGIGIIRIDIIRIHIPMDTRHFDQEESSMIYQHIKTGTFISRPNRFIAHVRLEGQTVVCHVKNTGRCRELLIPGVKVILQYHPDAAAAGRKTEYEIGRAHV